MYEYTQRIRDLINNPRIQYALLKNQALWLQLCSCLDVIGDSELAIDAYSAREFGASVEVKYLAVYGLLQALFLQQDAIFNLCESLEISERLDDYPKLKEIREIRNVSIGHPTKKDRPKSQPTSYHFISRATLSFDGFQLHSAYSDGKLEFKDISISDLIVEQRSYISEILSSIIAELERREAAHKEKFRMEKLTSVFPATLSYHFQKVFENIGRREDAAFALVNLQQINQAVQVFREALAKRDIELETYDSIRDLYELLEYPLAELEIFFQNVQSEKELNINEKAAYIFAFFVEKKVVELTQIAQEIDEYYSS